MRRRSLAASRSATFPTSGAASEGDGGAKATAGPRRNAGVRHHPRKEDGTMTPNTTTSLYRLQLVREADFPYETGILTCSASAAKFFRPLFEGLDREQMAVAFL